MAKIKTTQKQVTDMISLRKKKLMPHKHFRIPADWVGKLEDIARRMSNDSGLRVTFSDLVREAVQKVWIN